MAALFTSGRLLTISSVLGLVSRFQNAHIRTGVHEALSVQPFNFPLPRAQKSNYSDVRTID